MSTVSIQTDLTQVYVCFDNCLCCCVIVCFIFFPIAAHPRNVGENRHFWCVWPSCCPWHFVVVYFWLSLAALSNRCPSQFGVRRNVSLSLDFPGEVSTCQALTTLVHCLKDERAEYLVIASQKRTRRREGKTVKSLLRKPSCHTFKNIAWDKGEELVQWIFSAQEGK